MGKLTDPAFLFYARDWLTDLHVRAMSPAERGLFMDLLCMAWLEGGLPADLEQVRALLQMPKARFATVWGRIGPRWVELDGKLVNRRQETERALRAEKAEAMRRKGLAGNDARWHRDRPRDPEATPQRPPGDRPRDRASDPPAIAQGSPSTSSLRVLPPTPLPIAQGSPSRSTPAAEPETRDLTVEVFDQLRRTGYRSATPDPKRRFVLMQEAQRLVQSGMDSEQLANLVLLASGMGAAGDALLASWLDSGTWRDVLLQAKEAALRGRPGPKDDLDGIYGCDPQAIGAVPSLPPQRATGG